MEDKKLVEAARTARAAAYAPYSNFDVGAAIQAIGGTVYSGANIENAVYPLGCCAERVALYAAVFAGARAFSAIALAGGGHGKQTLESCMPCGACRQTLAEFCGLSLRVLVAKNDDEWDEYSLGDLLPHSFGAENLEK